MVPSLNTDLPVPSLECGPQALDRLQLRKSVYNVSAPVDRKWKHWLAGESYVKSFYWNQSRPDT